MYINIYIKSKGRKFSKHGFNKREKGSGIGAWLHEFKGRHVTKARIKATREVIPPNFRGNCGRRGRSTMIGSKQWTLVTGMNRAEPGRIIRINEWSGHFNPELIIT